MNILSGYIGRMVLLLITNLFWKRREWNKWMWTESSRQTSQWFLFHVVVLVRLFATWAMGNKQTKRWRRWQDFIKMSVQCFNLLEITSYRNLDWWNESKNFELNWIIKLSRIDQNSLIGVRIEWIRGGKSLWNNNNNDNGPGNENSHRKYNFETQWIAN